MYKTLVHYPQDEMHTSLLPVTTGCRYNKCNFCSMYRDEDYDQVAMSEIRKQLLNMDRYKERIFLTGADPLSIGFGQMDRILDTINTYLPYCSLVASYAAIGSITSYSEEELSILHDKGLGLLYIGFESGDDEILKLMNKPHRVEEAIEEARKLNRAGIAFNTIIMYGIAGRGKSFNNGLATARMINQFTTKSVITMNLTIFNDTRLGLMVEEGLFFPASGREKLLEIKTLIENLKPQEPLIFDTSHPTNIVKIKGILPRQKERLLRELRI